MTELSDAIRHGRKIIQQGLVEGHEYATRYAVIDPIIRALGWDTVNPRECRVEYPCGKYTVDYALFVKQNPHVPIVTIEAKSIGKVLLPEGERQISDQVRAIGRPPRPGIAVITNGEEWRIYNVNRSAVHFSTRYKKNKFVGAVDIMRGPREAESFLRDCLGKAGWVGGTTDSNLNIDDAKKLVQLGKE